MCSYIRKPLDRYKSAFCAQHKLEIVIYNKIIEYILFVRLRYDCNILLLTETLGREKYKRTLHLDVCLYDWPHYS